MADPLRLPRSVVPRRYELLVAPDLAQSTFSGEVAIALDISEPTNQIVLNARELDVALVRLVQADTHVAATLTVDAEHERLVITADRALAPGDAVLELQFDGKISHGLLGFYRSTFVDGGGNEQVLGATQFEATHARAAFPCFDEPEFKAIFAVTLVVHDGLLALSNGPELVRDRLPDGRVRIEFGETIPMSTYLVAWVVGPLEVTGAVDAGGVAVRVAHVPGKGHLTQFALDAGAFAIRFFTDYYGIPYPGEKCDLVALPDFSFGAMENLGCVTFRETRLLLDPAKVTLDEMSAAALTIVHEVAHMWFGDLVTMKWWNGIWLNEAFATFMEHIGVDAFKPDWRTWDDFAVGRAAALDVDALQHTRTVEYEVHTPEDADGMFDTLTYQKGGSVLRMLERWLGAEPFRAGVRHYLNRYALGNTETTDLWDALEDATGKPVRRIMDSWIFQPGFPVLDPSDGRITQSRFAYHGTGGDERYVAPVLVRVHDAANAQTQSLLLDAGAAPLDVSADALVVLNAGGEGFYRVAYPPAWRDRLLAANVLEPLERFSLVDDLWAFVLAGRASAAEFLACARQYRGEDELVVWRALAGHLRAAGRLVEGDALDAYRQVVREIAAPTIGQLGWQSRPGDDERVRQLRGLTIGLLGAFVGDVETIGRAREVIARPDTADPDVAVAAVLIVASVGNEDDFDDYRTRSDQATSPQEQLRYLHALGDFPSEQLVLRSCELALSDAVRPQNGPFLLQRAMRNREHGPAAWRFVRDHWDAVRDRFSPALVARIVEGTTWLVDDASYADVPAFVESHPVPEATRTIAQHLDRLHVHRATVERERERFSQAILDG
jgi:puromycin-sensitive aminopeptidase